MVKRGLYANIHAKRKRIAAGSGERSAADELKSFCTLMRCRLTAANAFEVSVILAIFCATLANPRFVE